MLEQMGKQAKDAAFILAQLNTTEKNHALSIIADQLEQQAEHILAANQKDIEEIPEIYRKGLEFHYVENIKQVWDFALTKEKVDHPIEFTITEENKVETKK